MHEVRERVGVGEHLRRVRPLRLRRPQPKPVLAPRYSAHEVQRQHVDDEDTGDEGERSLRDERLGFVMRHAQMLTPGQPGRSRA